MLLENIPPLIGSARAETRPAGPLRYAFLVNWDPASAASMKANLNTIDVLIPEWLHLGSEGKVMIDNPPLVNAVLTELSERERQPAVMPLINNYIGGAWRGDIVSEVMASPELRSGLINDLMDFVQKRGLDGLTIDFQETSDPHSSGLDLFLEGLCDRISDAGLQLGIAIPLEGADWDGKTLADLTDFVVVMAYDHHGGNAPGPVAPQDWVEENMRARVAEIGAEKVVLGVGNYGYDWRDGGAGVEVHSVHDVWRRAKEAGVDIAFDSFTLNPTFEYYDVDNEHRQVWFLDAVTAYNQIKSTEQLGLKGVAIWRLGAEDPALWRILDNLSSPDPADLTILEPGYALNYHGNGEILKVLSSSQPGERTIDADPETGLVSDETIKRFPANVEVARWGGDAGNRLVLTFDDGPDPETTPEILRILGEHRVPAAFFVTGAQVNRYPDLARRIVDQGHEIGNHTYTHPDLSMVPDLQLRMEINSTQRVIESTTGRATLLFRPPFGTDIEPRSVEQMRVVAEASSRGYYTVSMNIDGLDWRLSRAKAIAARVIKGAQGGAGHVILLHDSGGNRRETIKALPIIIETLRSDGFEFVSVAKLLGKQRDEIMPKTTAIADALLPLDTLGYLTLRALEYAIYTVFLVVIVLGLARSALIGLLSARARKPGNFDAHMDVSIGVLIAAYNEEKVICSTLASLLASNSPSIDILVVDDGSTDRTLEAVLTAFADEPRVRIVTKPNSGKADALNVGLRMLDHDIIIALDADTVFLPNTIRELVQPFRNERVGAVAGNAKVGNRTNWMTRFQALEYIIAQNLDRQAFERLNCISVVPGAVGAWRRDAIIRAGGFQSDTLAEDADLTLRIIRAGYLVVYADRAIALTEAPVDIRSFMKQRFRWTFGMMQAAMKHTSALTSSKPNTIGLVALPNIMLFQVCFTCLAPIADFVFVATLMRALVNEYFHPGVGVDSAILHIAAFYVMFLVVDYAIAIVAFVREPDESRSLLALVLVQRFFYRQLLYIVVIRAILAAFRGKAVGWFKLDRTGGVQPVQKI